MRHFNYDEVEIGDYIRVRIHNKQGDRNLDQVELYGIVVKKTDRVRQLHLASGWCCHEWDELLEHAAGILPAKEEAAP